MIIYKKGDLLQAPEDIIAHGCNCVGGFGSGVAGQISLKYPQAAKDYRESYKAMAPLQLGMAMLSHQSDGKLIFNCTTQNKYLPRGICHADYYAIKMAMAKVKIYAQDHKLSVAIPKIGAGLAGGDWIKIEAILNEVFHDYDVTVYEL